MRFYIVSTAIPPNFIVQLKLERGDHCERHFKKLIIPFQTDLLSTFSSH